MFCGRWDFDFKAWFHESFLVCGHSDKGMVFSFYLGEYNKNAGNSLRNVEDTIDGLPTNDPCFFLAASRIFFQVTDKICVYIFISRTWIILILNQSCYLHSHKVVTDKEIMGLQIIRLKEQCAGVCRETFW